MLYLGLLLSNDLFPSLPLHFHTTITRGGDRSMTQAQQTFPLSYPNAGLKGDHDYKEHLLNWHNSLFLSFSLCIPPIAREASEGKEDGWSITQPTQHGEKGVSAPKDRRKRGRQIDQIGVHSEEKCSVASKLFFSFHEIKDLVYALLLLSTTKKCSNGEFFRRFCHHWICEFATPTQYYHRYWWYWKKKWQVWGFPVSRPFGSTPTMTAAIGWSW